MAVSREGIRSMPRTNKPGDRWAELEKTTPSGKSIFRCLSCGEETPVPTNLCWDRTKKSSGELAGKNGFEPNLACLLWQKVKFHYYKLDNVKGEGWAIFVVSSTGYFSVVSDLGNYAFFWTHHGCEDFRQFLYNAHKDWDYFCSKLSFGPGDHFKVYSGSATYDSIREHILCSRRQRDWDQEKTREEWNLLNDECEKVATEGDWDHWMRETKISDPWEYHSERWPGGLERFCKETLKRLTEEHLHKELEAEGLLDGARR